MKRSFAIARLENMGGVAQPGGACHLPPKDLLEFFRRHPWAPQGALSLQEGRAIHHPNLIHLLVPPRFEQEGDIQDYARRLATSLSFQPSLAFCLNEGMDQGFEPFHGCGIAQHELSKRLPIYGLVLDCVWKVLANNGNSLTAAGIEPMHRCVGIMNRHAHEAQHVRRR